MVSDAMKIRLMKNGDECGGRHSLDRIVNGYRTWCYYKGKELCVFPAGLVDGNDVVLPP